MGLKPESGSIVMGGTTVLVDDVRYMTDVLFFERVEFSHERERQAPETNGTRPIFIQLPGGRQAQLQDGCVATTPRSLLPDDLVYDDIYRRFDIKRWIIEGASTPAANVDTVFTTAVLHKVLLNRFESHIAKGKTNISIDALLAMQIITGPIYTGFTYLTGTGYTITGMPVGSGTVGTINNALIVQFNPDVDYEEPLNSGGTLSRVMKRWAATIEVRTEVAALSTIY